MTSSIASGSPAPPPGKGHQPAARMQWVIRALALMALGQALLYALYLHDDPGNYNAAGMAGDQLIYLELSEEVRRGEWTDRGHFMPGYPAVLALAETVFGSAWVGTVVLQAVLYAALVLVVAKAAASAFAPGAGLWAAALLALQPALGYYAGQLMTEFLTGVLLVATGLFLWRWGREHRWPYLGAAAVSCAGAIYVRSEYLGLALLLGLVVFLVARARMSNGQAALRGLVLVAVVLALVSPWALRTASATGRLALHGESPVTNLVLMGTWFRIFDPDTWARLQEIEKSSLPNDVAIARAATVGPRPELSQRYMSQVRGPYERPLSETLQLALENVSMFPGEYLFNHLVQAPILIWAARNPMRHADLPSVPSYLRWPFWGLQLVVFALALWQAARSLRDERARMLAAFFLATVAFLTVVHVVIAVDERFTAPALPLVQTFAGAAVATLLYGKAQHRQQAVPAQPALAGGGSWPNSPGGR